MYELTKQQIERQEFVDNTLSHAVAELMPKGIGPDYVHIHFANQIGAFRTAVSERVKDLEIMTEQEFYPFIEEDNPDNEKRVYLIDIILWPHAESPSIMFDINEEGNKGWKQASENYGRIESLESFACYFNDDSINSDRYFIRIF